MNNDQIREEIRQSRFFNYEIADAIGITESAFSKWFRKPLTCEQQEDIIRAILRLKGGETNAEQHS